MKCTPITLVLDNYSVNKSQFRNLAIKMINTKFIYKSFLTYTFF